MESYTQGRGTRPNEWKREREKARSECTTRNFDNSRLWATVVRRSENKKEKRLREKEKLIYTVEKISCISAIRPLRLTDRLTNLLTIMASARWLVTIQRKKNNQESAIKIEWKKDRPIFGKLFAASRFIKWSSARGNTQELKYNVFASCRVRAILRVRDASLQCRCVTRGGVLLYRTDSATWFSDETSANVATENFIPNNRSFDTQTI